MMLEVKTYDMKGKEKLLTQVYEEIGPSTVRKYVNIGRQLSRLGKTEGIFLSLRLLDKQKQPISENFYWLADSAGNYSGLQHISPAKLNIEARRTGPGKISVTLSNAADHPVAFFNRISLIDPRSGKRTLPVFYSDNYVSVVPGGSKTIVLAYRSSNGAVPLVSVKGWNLEETRKAIE